MQRQEDNWMGKELKDMCGNPFEIGDIVIKAYTSGRCTNLELCKITSIHNGEKMYLNESKVAVKFPGRCFNVSKYNKS